MSGARQRSHTEWPSPVSGSDTLAVGLWSTTGVTQQILTDDGTFQTVVGFPAECRAVCAASGGEVAVPGGAIFALPRGGGVGETSGE